MTDHEKLVLGFIWPYVVVGIALLVVALLTKVELRKDNKLNYQKVLKGLGIALAGAAITYLAQLQFDFGIYTPVAVAVASALVNFGREYLKTAQS